MTTMPDSLCICGHLASHHADLANGDTRCLAVEDRRDLLDVFDDGRDSPIGYCACLAYRPAQPGENDSGAA
jgi:hypothetical protein